MIQNLDLYKIAEKLAKVLDDSAELSSYCQASFGKSLTIYVGEMNDSELPTVDDAPYIIIYGGSKAEGDADKQAHYEINVGCGIKAGSTALVVSGNTKYIPGYRIICEFQALIQTVLDEYRQISRINAYPYKPLEPDAGHWAGNMEIQWDIDQILSLGEKLEF